MFPRPLYRWKSFWLGLAVLAFLGWAWGKSTNHRSGVAWLSGALDQAVTLSQSRGQVDFNRYLPPFAVTAVPIGLSCWNERGGLRHWMQPAIDWHGKDGGGWGISLAHWFLILLFLVPWAGFLIWRVRRMKRLARALPAAQD